ncbi:hypothetical protein Vadar_016205 [Vaccinium darrowii]|uniref:Uncharacterized protein n=1 Tax=Vaccinium darrowii TaxID=229202 RepID=A0ACB7XHX0_9ERIC|nr:hypothetical protein Vadar_016205 [Vaccinium darrowii]
MAFKHLEINILSAQDLAPVSKLLRTYAVAWIHPDQKLTTRVDQRGHTNPTWNYRFVFALDHRFLASSSSSLTVEIYNVSWLRDIPIGCVHTPIANILPPPSQGNSKMRLVSLHILRPSGTLQGTLNLGVNVVDGGTRPRMPLERQLSAPTGGDTDSTVNRSPPRYSKRNYENLEEEEEVEDETTAKIRKLRRSQSERTDDDESLSKSSSIFRRGFNFHKVTTAPSISSYMMRPLPSEVAASMAKGLYSTPSSFEVGSSVLENWTVVGGGGVEEVVRTKSVRWKIDGEFTPLSKENKKKQSSGGGGLLSCFGFLCGYECNIVCGAPKKKKKKRRRFGESKVYVNHSVEDLGLLYR